MDWLFLFIAGLCEMVFVVMLKLSEGFKRIGYAILTVIFMSGSFFLLSLALKTIPIGTGYAIWTGIGAVGSVVLGMLVFKERKSVGKILFITMIITGVVGLKLTSGV
ncbi:multidrug efflux SMR transporter [Listeria sp. FSL L7-1485]|uniref:Multidrug efflux SMR transporter n=1 Tax=Listeria immobilis TaxID=2713502 RepID=A0A7X0X760_9LIST|nr:multidrug efflux SMR transporter [Listeria immobilis]MBC1484044.1 multidrug efflux SMR transporter [Listeria immobilis]MBC1488865.1 multidrug efflux SMR transporter [Listeria immobilis]MBC1505761.1 multidrug efflux SMR transporter [Listeria immobilis]MBC1508448.1 multidrug efflux SMR transporter [Listeria immobilis]MBC1514855.1 multidrug efflux SMR transporter [Listeria immobilis]